MIINYLRNLTRLLRRDRLLYPLNIVYYVTEQCNLNCAYCEDFGLDRNEGAAPSLPLADALRLLRIIRTGGDHLILTGGDPLLYPAIEELTARARRELKFRHITLQTNGLLLPQHEPLLRHVDRLVISLDTTDPDLIGELAGLPPDLAATILDNVQTYARRRREFGYRLVLNAVLSPRTLSGVPDLLDFCAAHDLLISFSPQAVNNWPRYELLTSEEYRRCLEMLLARKKRGAPILGSRAYLRTLLDLRPFSCAPTLTPRIAPNGDLLYPCRPIEQGGLAQGGRLNLLTVGSWAEALRRAAAEYGPPPRVCGSCFQQCFVEPSLMQAKPHALLFETLRYRASRRGGLATYAPG